MELAAQLWTVHSYTTNLKELDATLKRISEIGYKYVQVSGTCPYSPFWLKETLDKYGLKCIITHGEDPFDCLERSYKYLKSIGA